MARIKKVDYNEKYNVYYLQYNAIQTLCNKSCSMWIVLTLSKTQLQYCRRLDAIIQQI